MANDSDVDPNLNEVKAMAKQSNPMDKFEFLLGYIKIRRTK
jgi:hypothetical protein